MNPKGKKLEPKMKLEMPFGEALARFIQTKPKEVDRSIEKAKQKKPIKTRNSGRPANG